MNIHDEEVEQKLRKVNNIPDLAFRYVDDERYHLRGLKPGWRWDLRLGKLAQSLLQIGQ